MRKSEKIIFLGDSITDAHHCLGVDAYGLGDGYVSLAAQRLRRGRAQTEVLNRGHDGFTLRDVLRFLETDCLGSDPDVVSILVGCNDVGVAAYTGRAFNAQAFREDYSRLLAEIEDRTGAKILCMAPFIFPHPLEYASWIPHIRAIEKITEETAAEQGAAFIPLHDRLQEAARELGYGAVTVDGIHLAPQGARIVADAWCEGYSLLVDRCPAASQDHL